MIDQKTYGPAVPEGVNLRQIDEDIEREMMEFENRMKKENPGENEADAGLMVQSGLENPENDKTQSEVETSDSDDNDQVGNEAQPEAVIKSEPVQDDKESEAEEKPNFVESEPNSDS